MLVEWIGIGKNLMIFPFLDGEEISDLSLLIINGLSCRISGFFCSYQGKWTKMYE